MERVMNENTNYRVALYCRLSKDDEQTGESVSIETQKMLLTDYCVERGWLIHDTYVRAHPAKTGYPPLCKA